MNSGKGRREKALVISYGALHMASAPYVLVSGGVYLLTAMTTTIAGSNDQVKYPVPGTSHKLPHLMITTLLLGRHSLSAFKKTSSEKVQLLGLKSYIYFEEG